MVNWEAYSVKSLDLWSEKVSEELEACIYPAPLEVSYIKWIRNKCLHSCGYNQVRGSAAALSAELCMERRKKNPNSNSLLSCFQEPATRTECLWASSVQSAAERKGEAGGGEGIGRTFLLLFAFSFFGCWQEPLATRSAFNYRWRMMLALFLSVMSCTCKLQNILESHHCPLISPSPLSLPSFAPFFSLHPLRTSDSSSL